MPEPNLHVVTHEDGWAVKREKTATPESVHASQTEAIEAACAVAEQEHRSVIIHRRNGQIRNVQSFSDGAISADGHPAAHQLSQESRWKRRARWGAVLAGVAISMTVGAYLGYRCKDSLSKSIADRNTD